MTQITLPMTPEQFLAGPMNQGLALLPAKLDTVRARMWITAICLQESALAHRWQVVDVSNPHKRGPARGLAQFELGTEKSRGGVWGVFLHAASRGLLHAVCAKLALHYSPRAIWLELAENDALAVAVARLLLLTDPFELPATSDDAAGWRMYSERLWRPGKPHPGTWPGNCDAARRALGLQ